MKPSLMRKPRARTTGVAQRNRPVVLDEQQGGGRIVEDLLDDVPGVVVGEHADTVFRSLCTRLGARDHAFLSLDPPADQRADLAAELDRLVLGEDAQVLDLAFASDSVVR